MKVQNQLRTYTGTVTIAAAGTQTVVIRTQKTDRFLMQSILMQSFNPTGIYNSEQQPRISVTAIDPSDDSPFILNTPITAFPQSTDVIFPADSEIRFTITAGSELTFPLTLAITLIGRHLTEA